MKTFLGYFIKMMKSDLVAGRPRWPVTEGREEKLLF